MKKSILAIVFSLVALEIISADTPLQDTEEKLSWKKSARMTAPMPQSKSDTAKLQDMQKTVQVDDLLLELVKKSRKKDTAWLPSFDHIYPPSPLATPIIYIPPTPSLKDTVKSWLQYDINDFRNNARRYITTHCADLYVDVMDTIEQVKTDNWININIKKVNVEKFDLAKIEQAKDQQLKQLPPIPHPWIKELNVSLQASQNYISENWYQGGNSNVNVLGTVKGKILYIGKMLTWENVLDWRTGISTVSGDTLRKVNTSEDVFKITSKIGHKVFKKMNISFLWDFQTPFFRTWKSNQNRYQTTTLTPVRFNLSFGVDVKPIDGLNLVFLPVTYKMICASYSNPDKVTVTDYGIQEGEKILNDVGSSIKIDWLWKPHYVFAMTNAFNFYTNYRQVEIDWELTLDIFINHYLSAKVIVHPRYDNTIIFTDGEKAKIQFKEMVSIGFAHTFRK